VEATDVLTVFGVNPHVGRVVGQFDYLVNVRACTSGLLAKARSRAVFVHTGQTVEVRTTTYRRGRRRTGENQS
jgi:hypothetical protein